MTSSTQAHVGVRRSRAGRAAASRPDARPRRGDDRRLPRRARPDRGRDGPATIITDLGGNDLYTWAFTAYLLTSTISGPLYGKLSDLFGRRPIFLFGIGVFMLGSLLAGLSQEMWQLVGRARHPGPRRRRAVPDRAGGHRRPVRAVRARQVPGPVRRRVRPLGPDRPGHRRPAHRHDRLAVRVLLQPAGRRARVLRSCGATCRSYHLGGDKPTIDYLGAALFTAALVPILVGPDQQAVGRLDRSVGRRADRARRGDPARVRVRRVARPRADRAAQPVPQPLVHDLGRGGLPRRVRVLRDGRVPAALVPGRGRLVGDRVGLPDAAAARRPDHQRRRVGPDRQPDRALPAADLRRAGRDGGRACSC